MGIYTITVTATIPQPSVASGFKSVSTSFDLDMIDGCLATSFVPRIIPNVSTRVSQ